MLTHKICIATSLLLGGIVFVLGCADQSATSPAKSNPATNATAAAPTRTTAALVPNPDEHGHKPGAHGGIMASLGRDNYHVEAVFEKEGRLRLYTLGQDESRVIDVEKQTLKGFAKEKGDGVADPFTLEPEPQTGDASGRTSQFVGTLPKDLWGKSLDVTVPNIVISGERFRLGFKSSSEQHDEGMPTKIEDEEERKLYLTSGGMYTDADIKANGNVTASVKFKGVKSAHDMNPKPGDKICPITKTKANPVFPWTVGGKTYTFCCPPCIDEFVRIAKSTPNEIKDPSEYIKR